MVRLDRYIHERTDYSREKIKSLIRKGSVTVDFTVIKDPSYKITDEEEVRVNKELLSKSRYSYILLYKPSGVVTARTDDKDTTVMDVLKDLSGSGMSPVGRLDKDTEGVLLITDDGEMNHRMTSPKYHVEKKYYVECDRELPSNAAQVLEDPMEFKDFTTKGAKFEKLTDFSCYLTITEGKYHQVKRMFRRLNLEVTYLRRESFAFLTLDGLERGESRKLSETEIKRLKEIS